MNFFAYGTLMCADILQAVIGAPASGESARLYHFKKRVLKGEAYPGIIPDRNQTVEGIIYRRLSPLAFSRLDTFEGDMYFRPLVDVQTAHGTERACTYVLKKEFESRLSDTPWHLDWFLKNGKQSFEAEYFGFHALKKNNPLG